MYVGFIAIPVADIDRAKTFYVDVLGFTVQNDAPMPGGGRWVMLVPPGAQTAVVLDDGFTGRPGHHAGVELGHGLEVDDVFAIADTWKGRDVEFVDEPRNEFFGGWARFKDSEGNIWGLHSPGVAAAVAT